MSPLGPQKLKEARPHLPKNPAFDDVNAGKPEGSPKEPVTGTAALRSSFETELNNLNK